MELLARDDVPQPQPSAAVPYQRLAVRRTAQPPNRPGQLMANLTRPPLQKKGFGIRFEASPGADGQGLAVRRKGEITRAELLAQLDFPFFLPTRQVEDT